MNTKQDSNAPTIIAVLLLLVSVVALFALVFPQKDKLEATNSKLSGKQVELNLIKAEIVEFANLEESFSGSEVTKKDVLNLIPSSMEENRIIEILAELADENEVSLNSMSFSVSEGGDTDINRVSVNLNIGGGHQDLIRFLKGLENESRKFKVKTISVQTLQNRLENMNISVETYFL